MKIIDGLNYRDWQKRNTNIFSRLSRKQQNELRAKGYKNVGWLNVQRSWIIIRKIVEQPEVFQRRLDKGDVLGAIRHAILESDQAKKIAKNSLQKIEDNYQDLHNLAQQALSKYHLL